MFKRSDPSFQTYQFLRLLLFIVFIIWVKMNQSLLEGF